MAPNSDQSPPQTSQLPDAVILQQLPSVTGNDLPPVMPWLASSPSSACLVGWLLGLLGGGAAKQPGGQPTGHLRPGQQWRALQGLLDVSTATQQKGSRWTAGPLQKPFSDAAGADLEMH